MRGPRFFRDQSRHSALLAGSPHCSTETTVVESDLAPEKRARRHPGTTHHARPAQRKSTARDRAASVSATRRCMISATGRISLIAPAVCPADHYRRLRRATAGDGRGCDLRYKLAVGVLWNRRPLFSFFKSA
jgi:hypothetical protein